MDMLRSLLAVILFSAAGCAVTSAKVKDSDSLKVGDTFVAHSDESGELTFRLEKIEVDADDPEHETQLYTVSFQNPDTGEWVNYCQPDMKGWQKAIPLSGYWDSTGRHIDDPNTFTLACTMGVIGKCVRWGYKPWSSANGKSLADLHQACTRMARADYCGDGHPHTKNGTQINLFDIEGVQHRDADTGMQFEAAWSPEGATYINKARYAQTLQEIVSECPQKLSGRTSGELGLLNTPEEVRTHFPESIIFNESFVRTDKPD